MENGKQDLPFLFQLFMFMQWNFIRSHYSIFIIVIMDIQLLIDGIVIRYIDYQTMNENGLKSERLQKDILSELHR